LKLHCGKDFNVNLQAQHWASPSIGEQQVLGITRGRYANIREVLLCKGDAVLVVARTVIPRQILTGRVRHLISLGSKPLGEVIFSEPGLHRGSFEIAELKPEFFQANLFPMAIPNQSIWGRRSCYIIHNKPILISEIFLPALFGN
jgi:chorismate--pyruvate lyase